jgi:trans-aconitate methyltransferase
MPPEVFEGRTCSAPPGRSARMAAIAASVLPPGSRAVLDLGCGTGRLARLIADAHPGLSVVGIDISSANIAAAVSERADSRVRFEQADYLQYAGGPFDLVVTDGVLHLIPGDTKRLIRKLGNDLRPGGMLVCCMPYACAFNRAAAVARRALRSARTARLDNAILTAARWLHADMTPDDLRERVPDMYMPPMRMMDHALRDAMARDASLRFVGEQPMPSVSLAQLRHNVSLFRKDSAET